MINLDNNIENSDWIKWRRFDVPGKTSLNDIMEMFDIPFEDPIMTERLAGLNIYPWVGSLDEHPKQVIRKAAELMKKAEKKANRIIKDEQNEIK